jgi:hypothetical protein
MSEIQVRRDETDVRRHIDVGRTRSLRGRVLGALAAIGLAGLALCASASANLRSDLQKFAPCPYNNTLVSGCLYSPTTSGEFIVGKGTVPITKPVILQAGLVGTTGALIPPESGEELSKTALPIPGGLVGIELLGNFTEVTATAELARPASYTSKINLPLKVKLDNPLNVVLGSGCYIGSEAEPLELHLGAETTNPPPPNTPITGKANFSTIDGGAIQVIEQTLVDNAFAAPGANGCTLLPPVGDLAVNTKEGLPAAAGTNTAIMTGFTYNANALLVRAVLKLPELGRCALAPTHKGTFTDSACISETGREDNGKYEWLPGPGAAGKFKGVSTAMTLESVGKTKVTCTASSSEGEYTGPKTQTVSLRLTGCSTGAKAALKPCQSAGAGAGEIQTSTLAGSLDFIKENLQPTLPVIGVDLKPASGSELAAFECGGSAQSLSGSVIAPITVVDKMKSSFKEKAAQTGGIQAPEAFEEQSKDTLSLGGEQAGLKGTVTQTNEEALEIKGMR